HQLCVRFTPWIARGSVPELGSEGPQTTSRGTEPREAVLDRLGPPPRCRTGYPFQRRASPDPVSVADSGRRSSRGRIGWSRLRNKIAARKRLLLERGGISSEPLLHVRNVGPTIVLAFFVVGVPNHLRPVDFIQVVSSSGVQTEAVRESEELSTNGTCHSRPASNEPGPVPGLEQLTKAVRDLVVSVWTRNSPRHSRRPTSSTSGMRPVEPPGGAGVRGGDRCGDGADVALLTPCWGRLRPGF